VTSIDVSSELLQRARDTNERCKYVLNDAMETCFPEETFDAVVGVAILHHLEFSKAIQEIHRVLAPGGRFAFAEPNLLNPYIAMIVSFPWFSRITKMYQSSTETACRPWVIGNRFYKKGFRDISVTPFDFLYPKTPASMVPLVRQFSDFLSKTPFVRWFGGSLKISGTKPS
jgi:ubiquinone/menaquinone biosynthesis C-methylase UbiE